MLCIPVEPLELLDQIHGRSLLGKKGDPAKTAWEPKTNRKSATVFVQVSSAPTFPLSAIRDQLFWACAHICGTSGAVQHLSQCDVGAASMLICGRLCCEISCMQSRSCIFDGVALRSCAQSL